MEIGTAEKLVVDLHDKTEYVIQIRNLNQVLNLGLVLKRLHKVINFNQKTWTKLCTIMNTDLRKVSQNDFEKDFLA